MSDINSWWDLNPIRTTPDRDELDWLDDYAPGGDLWPRQYGQELQIAFELDAELSTRIGPSAKQVIINDYLAAGQMYVTDHEIILSRHGWEALLAQLDRQQYAREMVSRIIEREMGDVLTWLRGAGHDV